MNVISSVEIEKHISMSDLVNEIAKSYLILDEGKSFMPLRTVSDLGSGNSLALFKTAIENESGLLAVKFLNQLKETSKEGYPTIQGLVILIDSRKNEILSIMDGRTITAYRTGAASGLATKLLARENSEVLAIFGAGTQAYTQIKAVLSVRKIRKIIIFDLLEKAIDRLISYFSYLDGVEFIKGKSNDILKEVDIICSVTNSVSPLFSTEDLKEGVHINAIGSFTKDMREMPDDVYTGAALYVDHKESCFKESGDIIIPFSKNLINENNYRGELMELLERKITGRDNAKIRTIFKSVGIATQDLITANFIYLKSKIENFGTEIAL